MNEQEIKNLLQQADKTANKPAWAGLNIKNIRHRAGRRRIIKIILPPATAAVLLITTGIWIISAKSNNRIHQTEKTASIEARIEKLQASTDSAINLIQEVLEQQRRQKQLDELNARLASIPDPLEEIQKQVDKTAFILVYQADRMYRELNETDSAVETYKRVIKLFPENQWAQVARERLDEIERKSKNNSSKGDSKWKSQST
jgi:tetratricopeptide (TPR) repeat protein